jgi:hypothetical protein
VTDEARTSGDDSQHKERDKDQEENDEPVVEAGKRRLVSALARARCTTGDDITQEVHAARLLAMVGTESECRTVLTEASKNGTSAQ